MKPDPRPLQCACGQTSRFFEETHPSNAVRAEKEERPTLRNVVSKWVYERLKTERDHSRKRIEELEAALKDLTKERDELHSLVLSLSGESEEEMKEFLEFKFKRKQI